MPNHVSHLIEFTCEHTLAERIIAQICDADGSVDFLMLIPKPIHIYSGGLSLGEDNDFRGHTWHEWNKENWGTKWNAYDGWVKNKNGSVKIYFETAWSIPYPWIIAFANQYGLEFSHKYYDEGDNFWGIDTWKNKERETRNRDPEDIQRELRIELRGFDPEEDVTD